MSSRAAFRFDDKMNFDFHAPHARVEMNSALQNIEQADLVRRLMEDELAYLFKHALVQESAYATLMKQRRKQLHQLVGATLERTYPERLDEFAAQLAEHFSEAGDNEKKLMYAERAGDAAVRVFALPEAHAFYQRALDAAANLPDTPTQRRRGVDLIIKLVAVSLRAQGPEWSLNQLRIAENLLRDLPTETSDRERLMRVHFWMGDAYSHLNQQREAIDYLQQVLDSARQGVQDETLLAIPSNVIGRALAAQGKFSQAEPLLAQAAPLLEQSANWYEWVLAVGFLGFALGAQGKTEAGLQETERALTRARALGTTTGIGDSHIFATFIQHEAGDYDAAYAHASAALEAAAKLNDHLLLFLAHNARGWATARLGKLDAAEADFLRAHEIAAQMGGQLFFADMFYAAYAELALAQGNAQAARERAERAIEMARDVGSLFSEGIARRVLAQTLSSPLADEQFAASIALFEAGNAQPEAAYTRTAWNEKMRGEVRA